MAGPSGGRGTAKQTDCSSALLSLTIKDMASCHSKGQGATQTWCTQRLCHSVWSGWFAGCARPNVQARSNPCHFSRRSLRHAFHEGLNCICSCLTGEVSGPQWPKNRTCTGEAADTRPRFGHRKSEQDCDAINKSINTIESARLGPPFSSSSTILLWSVHVLFLQCPTVPPNISPSMIQWFPFHFCCCSSWALLAR